jgi:hypothetical protein
MPNTLTSPPRSSSCGAHSASSTISVAFAFFFVPETKGLSLEQVDRMLEEVSPRKSRSWVPNSTFASEMGLVEKGIPLPGGRNGDSAEENELETDAVPASKEVV